MPATVTDEQIVRFSSLFTGYQKAFGKYEVNKIQDNGKHVGRAVTVNGEITTAMWRDHLNGVGSGLGIIMLQENDTCRFGAIDVDDYHVDHARLCKQVATHNLPLVVCRTKSGGAHLYVFSQFDVPADIIRDRLAEWCALLGLSAKTEQFPKQISRASPTETGNWINIPYHDAERGVRFAISEDGEAYTLDRFLDYAESKQVSYEAIRISVQITPKEQELFHEGPPCLVMLHSQGGFSEGTRNDGMLSVGIYLKKRYPDEWQEFMDPYNRAMANLPAAEIVNINKSLTRKDYRYPCKRAPINAVCQRRTCLGREFGVGTAGAASVTVELLALVRYDYPPPDPPMWAFEVNGKRVMVDNDTFYGKDMLNRAIMAQANCVPIHMAGPKWLEYLNTLIQSADVVTMPDDASPTGQLWERVKMFLGLGVPALTKEEIFTGKVLREDDKVYFRSVDLFSYLDSRRVKYKTEQIVWQLLRDKGGDKLVWNVLMKDKSRMPVNVWVVPFKNQEIDADFNVLPNKIEEF